LRVDLDVTGVSEWMSRTYRTSWCIIMSHISCSITLCHGFDSMKLCCVLIVTYVPLILLLLAFYLFVLNDPVILTSRIKWIFRPHCSTSLMQPIVTDRLAWSVCLSVSQCVCRSRDTCINSWTADAIRVVVSSGLMEPCIRWGPDAPMGRGNFEGEQGQPIVKYSDALPWGMQKWLNPSRCRLRFGIGWVRESIY